MSTKPEDPDLKFVTYEMPDGTLISNDPRYQDHLTREQILATMENTGRATPRESDMVAGGVFGTDTTPITAAEIQRRGFAVAEVEHDAPQGGGLVPSPNADEADDEDDEDDESEEDDDEDEDEGNGYKDMKAKDLQKLAKSRNLDVAGLTKKSQFIAVLETADEADAGEG